MTISNKKIINNYNLFLNLAPDQVKSAFHEQKSREWLDSALISNQARFFNEITKKSDLFFGEVLYLIKNISTYSGSAVSVDKLFDYLFDNHQSLSKYKCDVFITVIKDIYRYRSLFYGAGLNLEHFSLLSKSRSIVYGQSPKKLHKKLNNTLFEINLIDRLLNTANINKTWIARTDYWLSHPLLDSSFSGWQNLAIHAYINSNSEVFNSSTYLKNHLSTLDGNLEFIADKCVDTLNTIPEMFEICYATTKIKPDQYFFLLNSQILRGQELNRDWLDKAHQRAPNNFSEAEILFLRWAVGYWSRARYVTSYNTKENSDLIIEKNKSALVEAFRNSKFPKNYLDILKNKHQINLPGELVDTLTTSKESHTIDFILKEKKRKFKAPVSRNKL